MPEMLLSCTSQFTISGSDPSDTTTPDFALRCTCGGRGHGVCQERAAGPWQLLGTTTAQERQQRHEEAVA